MRETMFFGLMVLVIIALTEPKQIGRWWGQVESGFATRAPCTTDQPS